MIVNKDSLEFLKTFDDFTFDINYSDPPYALGSEVVIRQDGKVDYKKANDFMNKWEMPTGAYWEEWFKEAYRTLKHGGYLIMFGMDRQLLLFKYYANLAGFTEQQSLYWFFISNFPKATDLSKQIDKNNGRNYNEEFRIYIDNKRKEKNTSLKEINELFELSTNGGGVASYIFSERKRNGLPTKKQYQLLKVMLNLDNRFDELVERAEAEREVIGKSDYTIPQVVYDVANGSGSRLEQNITAPSTDLAKKYEGYKYSISPLKQTNETIMCFQKPYKTGSCLHDTLAYENGDDTCCCGALDIDGNRVETSDVYDIRHYQNEDCFQNLKPKETQFLIKEQPTGRYPSQTFVNSNTAEILGEPSKILHKCDFEENEHDLYFYNPKVSKSERNAGCDGNEQQYSHDGRNKEIENPYQRNKSVAKNNHPTLKPIKLNERILKLFKTPNDQKIIYPFAGSGSEIIGGIKAGFNNWIGCEINPDYVEIAKARIDYWSKQDNQMTIFDVED